MASTADPDEDESPWFLAIPAWAAAEPPVLARASYDDQTAHTREALVRAARQMRLLHAYCPSDDLAHLIRDWLAASEVLEDQIRRHMIRGRQAGIVAVQRRGDAGPDEPSPPQVFQLSPGRRPHG